MRQLKPGDVIVSSQTDLNNKQRNSKNALANQSSIVSLENVEQAKKQIRDTKQPAIQRTVNFSNRQELMAQKKSQQMLTTISSVINIDAARHASLPPDSNKKQPQSGVKLR